mmetsp:Transcript_59875/g.136849  ORF Transcript_59875/g.136849 Transcript_59875/m.136849 type:complete len:230 (+) Transcript_59875:141-830(+)
MCSNGQNETADVLELRGGEGILYSASGDDASTLDDFPAPPSMSEECVPLPPVQAVLHLIPGCTGQRGRRARGPPLTETRSALLQSKPLHCCLPVPKRVLARLDAVAVRNAPYHHGVESLRKPVRLGGSEGGRRRGGGSAHRCGEWLEHGPLLLRLRMPRLHAGCRPGTRHDIGRDLGVFGRGVFAHVPGGGDGQKLRRLEARFLAGRRPPRDRLHDAATILGLGVREGA